MKRALLTCLLLTPVHACLSASGSESGDPHVLHDPRAWAADDAWYDGLAEMAVYAAVRPIYGVPRSYVATAYTNKQRMDPASTTKAAGDAWVEVFKHHWSERAPTEKYDYDFSTACFLQTDDLTLFKLTASTQEDCGASFKQIWQAGGSLRWFESVYFPGAGVHEGTLEGAAVAEDALPLLLRNFPFEEALDGAEESRAVRVALLPSQKSTRRVAFEPLDAVVRYEGIEELNLPIGTLAAHHLRLSVDGEKRADFWFATGGPYLNAMVRYEDASGVSYALSEHERTAYWAR